jgi:hypothetical protein
VARAEKRKALEEELNCSLGAPSRRRPRLGGGPPSAAFNGSLSGPPLRSGARTYLQHIMDPDFYSFRIPDLGSLIPHPKTATKERVEKKFVVKPFFVATNFTKLKIILFF